MKGLLVFVYRPADSERSAIEDGVSWTHDMLVMTGPGIPQVFEPSESHPEVCLVTESIFCGDKEVKRVYVRPPLNHWEDSQKWQFGGNFVYSSDERFPNFGAPGARAVPIHVYDREE